VPFYLREQQIVLRPIIKLFKTHQIVIVGDREFHSVELAQWIDRQGVKFVLRQKTHEFSPKKTKIKFFIKRYGSAWTTRIFLRN
jgi:hypothetical protein